MRKPVFSLALLALLALLPRPALAQVQPHALFTDGMVLQRGVPCTMWGTSSPEEKVSYSLDQGTRGTATGNTTADRFGNWKLTTPNLQAGGPYTLTLSGKNTITLKDVYVGDVWVASGQSNMEWPLSATENGKEAIANSANAKIRLFTVPKKVAAEPQKEIKSAWKECGPATVGSFSAVAYYFGRDLQKHLDVPIGLINTSWGGTVAEAWTPRQALAETDKLKELLPKGEIKPGNPNQGTVLYNGMIAPLQPFAIKGAIWYQGESNAGNPTRAEEYRTLFPTLIKSWRETWKVQGNEDFPFLFVQLAPFMKIENQPTDTAWARLRDAQRYTTRTVPKTAMAVITDVGDEKDIHPRKKEPVGSRLALAARALGYGEKIEYSGPVYESMKIEGNKAILTFSHVGKGLEARNGELTGFTIAGADHKFHNARAEIKGDKVVVWADGVDRPAAVRFGWANYPVVNLWNKDGLPASPFRTDDWGVGPLARPVSQ
jgi:sialate O-acetylesterase